MTKTNLSKDKLIAAEILDLLPDDSVEEALSIVTQAYTYIVLGYMSSSDLLTEQRKETAEELLQAHNDYVRANVARFSTKMLATLKERLGT